MEYARERQSCCLTGCVGWLALSITASAPASACSCDSVPLADYADRVTLAFTGSVADMSAEDPEVHMDVAFAVDEVYKGAAAPSITLATKGDTCGLDSQLSAQGDHVAVVAFGPDDPPTLSGCGSVVSADEMAAVFGPPESALSTEASSASGAGRNRLAISAAGVAAVAGAGLALVGGYWYFRSKGRVDRSGASR